MANISCASGEVIFNSNSRNALEAVVKYLKSHYEDSHYSFVMEEDEQDLLKSISTHTEDFMEAVGVDSPQQYSLATEFYGDGRWSFSNTLTSYFLGECDISEFDNEQLAALNEAPVYMNFEYIDYELGCEFIVEDSITLEVTADAKKVVYEFSENLPFNAENLAKVGEELVDSTRLGIEYVQRDLADITGIDGAELSKAEIREAMDASGFVRNVGDYYALGENYPEFVEELKKRVVA